MKYHLIGFIISALLHIGVFLLLNTIEPIQPPKITEPIPLSLAMFKPEPVKPKPAMQAPEPVENTKSNPIPEPVAKAVKVPVKTPKSIIKKTKPKKKTVKVQPKKKVIKEKKAKKKKPRPKLRPTPPKPHVVAKKPPAKKAIINRPPVSRARPIARAKQTPPRKAASPHRQVRAKQIRKPSVNPAQVAHRENAYKTRLHQLIAANKRYPRRAKRMGKQGTVRVTFIILANGLIKNIKILASSGNSGLDQAAIKALKRSSGKLPFPKEINKKQWVITVPITYQLN